MKNRHDELREAEKNAEYGRAAAGEIPCPINGCDETVPKTRPPKHIREAHSE